MKQITHFCLEGESPTLNWQFWLFRQNLLLKGISSQKQKREHHHWILHIRISLGTEFQLKTVNLENYFNILKQICPKKALPIKIEKTEHRHWIPHIRVSLGIGFQLKLTILTFWTKFTQRGRCRSQMNKVNAAIKFWIFELV